MRDLQAGSGAWHEICSLLASRLRRYGAPPRRSSKFNSAVDRPWYCQCTLSRGWVWPPMGAVHSPCRSRDTRIAGAGLLSLSLHRMAAEGFGLPRRRDRPQPRLPIAEATRTARGHSTSLDSLPGYGIFVARARHHCAGCELLWRASRVVNCAMQVRSVDLQPSSDLQAFGV